MRKTTLALAGLGIALAACGGGGTKTTATGTQPASTTTAKAVTGSASGSDYCKLTKAYAAKADEFATAFKNVDPSKPESFRAALQKILPQFRDSIARGLAVAPPEIKADVTLWASAFVNYLRILEKANFDYSKLSPEDLKTLSDPKVTAATQRITRYGAEKCGITAPAGLPS